MDGEPDGRRRRIVAWALGVIAGLVFLASGSLVLVALTFDPYSDKAVVLIGFKLVDLAGWLAIGGWLETERRRRRLRVVIPPVVAWLWAYWLAWTMSGGLGLGAIILTGPCVGVFTSAETGRPAERLRSGSAASRGRAIGATWAGRPSQCVPLSCDSQARYGRGVA